MGENLSPPRFGLHGEPSPCGAASDPAAGESRRVALPSFVVQEPVAIVPSPAPASLQPFLSADVGGTHARLALAVVDAGGTATILQSQQYACASHPGLAAILRAFATSCDAAPDRAVVAIAGTADGDDWINTNLPWPVSLSATRDGAGLAELVLVNDFEAMARAVPQIDRSALHHVCGPGVHDAGRSSLVLGAGTGLGAAVRLPPPRATVLATEAGHAALAAGTPRELDLVRALLQRWPHVDNERVLSGPGLVNAYEALCALDGVMPRLRSPADIVAARADADPQAAETQQLFCAMLGSLAGDLALTFGVGAVYLAGGIPWRMRECLAASDFAVRFRNKGLLGTMLSRVPVWAVEHGQLGVLGAAIWYASRRDAD
jgi:glucokinase